MCARKHTSYKFNRNISNSRNEKVITYMLSIGNKINKYVNSMSPCMLCAKMNNSPPMISSRG